jgi:hypothetical protein
VPAQQTVDGSEQAGAAGWRKLGRGCAASSRRAAGTRAQALGGATETAARGARGYGRGPCDLGSARSRCAKLLDALRSVCEASVRLAAAAEGAVGHCRRNPADGDGPVMMMILLKPNFSTKKSISGYAFL